MPSQPLSPDRSAVVKLHTRIDVEAIDIAVRTPLRGDLDDGHAATVPRAADIRPTPAGLEEEEHVDPAVF